MTPNSDTPCGYITRTLSGSWLTNGHLEVCLLKLATPTESEWKNDENRLENLAIVTKLLQADTAPQKSILEQEMPAKPVIVVAPELAFGSPDYAQIDTLINQYPHNLIFICGFGFTEGAILTDLANKDNVEGVWQIPPITQKKYNCGWVWIKETSNIQCYIFLKNFEEQTHEISIPNLEQGDQILRLEGDDLIVFPTICADLISEEVSSPRKRIAISLHDNCSTSKKTLITGSLLNQKSSSGWWKTAIGDLLDSTKSSNPRLMLSNCENPLPVQDEEDDKWRCLSGAYQNFEDSKSPIIPLPNVRYVDDTKFSGLLVRNPEVGCVFGKLNWSNNQAVGLHVLSPGSKFVWTQNQLQRCDGECSADELHRFIRRYKANAYHTLIGLNSNARTLAETKLDELLLRLSHNSSSSLRNVAELLFLRCLKGIDKIATFNPEKLYTEKDALDCAITTLVLIQHALDAELMPEGKELDQGQILSADGEREVLVWDSSEYTAKRLHEMISETVVKDGGSARPLTILGRGNGGGTNPPSGRVTSTRLADITNASSLTGQNQSIEKDICESSDRVVYWKNQGEIDEVLMSTNSDQNLKTELKLQINSV